MITIKDFKAGETVYVLKSNKGRIDKPEVTERIVKAAGRKYVTLDNDEKYEDNNRDFLLQAVNYGEKQLLFHTKTEVTEYLEKHELTIWFRNHAVYNIGKYSLEQLRKVKEILEP